FHQLVVLVGRSVIVSSTTRSQRSRIGGSLSGHRAESVVFGWGYSRPTAHFSSFLRRSSNQVDRRDSEYFQRRKRPAKRVVTRRQPDERKPNRSSIWVHQLLQHCEWRSGLVTLPKHFKQRCEPRLEPRRQCLHLGIERCREIDLNFYVNQPSNRAAFGTPAHQRL